MSDKKPRKSLLNDVFKYTDKGRDEFVKKVDDEVIDASEVFKAKKKRNQDKHGSCKCQAKRF